MRRAKLPRWFLPSTEIDFKSFADFNRGVFGSVYLSKWFSTSAKKRIFTDADDLKTMQAQVRRKADVQFLPSILLGVARRVSWLVCRFTTHYIVLHHAA